MNLLYDVALRPLLFDPHEGSPQRAEAKLEFVKACLDWQGRVARAFGSDSDSRGQYTPGSVLRALFEPLLSRDSVATEATASTRPSLRRRPPLSGPIMSRHCRPVAAEFARHALLAKNAGASWATVALFIRDHYLIRSAEHAEMNFQINDAQRLRLGSAEWAKGTSTGEAFRWPVALPSASRLAAFRSRTCGRGFLSW